MEDIDDMYSDDEEDGIVRSHGEQKHGIERKGRLVEVTIDGTRVSVPDAAFAQDMMRAMETMRTTVLRLSQDLRTVSSRLTQAEMEIRRLNGELDKKVGYE